MSSTTSHPPIARELLDLLSSMRFAITLLSVICIASVIGTVLRQSEPMGNYINQFGPFWAEVFGRVGLYTVYSAPWFLAILAFLVLSTSLCIARNAPKILVDLRSYKEGVREQSLQAHHHKAIGEVHSNPPMALAEIGATLTQFGWKARVQQRDHGTMIAARRGAANKIGYLAAHSSIVLILIGGVLDGNAMVQLAMWLQDKQLYTGSGFVAEIKPEHRLSTANPSFRGNVSVTEQQRQGIAVLSLPSGVVLQDLPFDIELKKFNVDYYSTGMPKSFASDIVIHDGDERREATVKVNEPVIHKGLAIYQSSFEDGGSKLKLQVLPLTGGKPGPIEGRVGSKMAFGDQTLELDGLRVINVENLAGDSANPSGVDVRKVDLGERLSKHLGSGAKGDTTKTLHNVGPSFSYKLRDAAGQAREYSNYMLPVELDGQKLFLAGMRDTPAENFRYLRMPADENGDLTGWLRLRQALAEPALRDAAARRYAVSATPPNQPQLTPQLQLTAQRALTLFSGAAAQPGDEVKGGLPALSQFIERDVPEADRQRVSEVLLRILNGSLFELNQLARERASLKPATADTTTQAFMTQAVLSLSDSLYYPAPMLLQLQDFEQVQASVFQIARAPGQKLVYLGAILLIIGVFAMLYIKERRLWVWIAPSADPGSSHIRMAMSSTRESPDNATLFAQIKAAVLKDSA
ncbi:MULTISPECIES: cytochrome c biogenesis protein ResB [unclassified Roseateles]|uniref:cytochrome c biogenesis protein ResB n=1 Tax=unclassified Roseateles TaxID=2626991 RepID=UPI0006F31E9B|nr:MULTISPECIES: cytochrome c biogenesis protein ResB [unclassified Roseateles]KQW52344.1 cytochrome C biogenesis protein ResB [Pelomonas sp. Root405]KRA78577.1 cytochrome C biogenesis protein ResB [Pelomonas sp. Root662]